MMTLAKEMTVLEQANQLLLSMKRAEKAQLLQWVVRDLGDAAPGIESNPNVCGGEPCIVRTRIPVWVLEQARRLGTSEANLLQCYPSLRAEDLTNAWAYVRSHPSEIEQQIRENEKD
ncbi:MAG: DUF433 domain-containing protein [Candidatus Parabeggiatoa sp.]|nr:DUF433 domain-containing protein [Candidatus Parabeggiatoa sp.]